MTLEQLMRSKGYTDQEVADLAPVLNNPKFRATLEAELTNGEKALKDLDEYDKWFTNDIAPEHQNLLKRAADAEAEAAAAKARFEAYQKSGMIKHMTNTDPAAAAAAAEEAANRAREEAKKGQNQDQFVRAEVFNAAYEKTGDAIAIAMNIGASHAQLFPGQFLDMEDLRKEAKAAKLGVKEYWEKKYNVPGRKAEMAATAKAAEEAKIRQDERQKVIVEMGGSNPGVRIMQPSNNPFVVRQKKEADKQPWERNNNEITRDRIEKAVQKAVARGEIATV